MNHTFCKLCIYKKIPSLDQKPKKLPVDATLLQHLLGLYNIKLRFEEVDGSICNNCMKKVLYICSTLHAWKQSQNELVNKEAVFNKQLEILVEVDSPPPAQLKLPQTSQKQHVKKEAVLSKQLKMLLEEEQSPPAQLKLSKTPQKQLVNKELEILVEEEQPPPADLDCENTETDAAAISDAINSKHFALAIAQDGSILGSIHKVNQSHIFACNYCQEPFKRIVKLLQHIRCHYKRSFMCRKCGMEFERNEQLQQHELLRRHTSEAKEEHSVDYRCEQCGCLFDRFFCLSRHYREVHRAQSQYYKCDMCQEQFKYKPIYEKHMKQHLGVRQEPSTSHSCKECGKTFERRYQLTTHSRVHTGEKPYKCEPCGKQFAHRGNLMLHQRTVHAQKRPHECEFCLQRFTTTTHLKKHIIQHGTMDS